MLRLTLHITGMSCGHCLSAVNQALAALPGSGRRSVRIGRAEVRYDPALIDPAQIVAAVDEAGYHAVPTEA